MRFFANSAVAKCIMVLTVALSVFLGPFLTLGAMRQAAEDIFFLGAYSDGLSINSDLEEAAAEARNLVTVAERYLPEGDSRMNAVLEAASHLVNTPFVDEKNAAAASLIRAVSALEAAVAAEALSDSDAQYVARSLTNFNGRFKTIANDPYHREAQRFNDTLRRFPARLFGALLNIRPLELFTAGTGG
ncbi:LemA family protein [Oscillospiraceae bacterium OttesenSCG-928-F05]|nr:LemA family protein [Oscillospiraceae bacterium OttesenSCG-928-F05]